MRPTAIETNGTTASPLLRISGLRVRLQRRDESAMPVDDVSFEIAPGEIVGLVGESGSGKSLTALAIMGLLPRGAAVDQGSIEFKGVDLALMSDRELQKVRGSQIGMILQDPHMSLNPVFRIGNQMRESLRQVTSKLSGAERQGMMIELLQGVGIGDAATRLEQYPHQLSGGMKQRVVGAMTLGATPQLIIADEPTTALDVTVQAQFLEWLSRMRDETNTALLLISHDLGVIAEVCDRVLVMYMGRILEVGRVEEVLEVPQHPYTEALLASRRMETKSDGTLLAIPGQPPTIWTIDRVPCRFASRCAYVFDECSEEPPIIDVRSSPTHRARCWKLKVSA